MESCGNGILFLSKWTRNRHIQVCRNATQLMQPLDVGVFWPLKSSWYKHLRAHTKQNPEDMTRKQNCLTLGNYMLRFLRNINSTNKLCICSCFQVDRARISDCRLKPALTYEENLDETLLSPSSSMSTSSAAPTTFCASPHLTLLSSPPNPFTSSTDSAIINAEVNSGLDLFA